MEPRSVVVDEGRLVVAWQEFARTYGKPVLGIVRRGFDGANGRIVVVAALLAT